MTETAFQHGLAFCPGCDTALAAPFQAAGRTACCKACATRFTLPDAEDLFQSAVAYLLEHDGGYEEEDEMDDITPQIQQETMAPPEPAADTDFAWLG